MEAYPCNVQSLFVRVCAFFVTIRKNVNLAIFVVYLLHYIKNAFPALLAIFNVNRG